MGDSLLGICFFHNLGPPFLHDIEMTCPFCNPERQILAENSCAYAIADGYAVSQGHTLVIPKRHAETIFDLTHEEYIGCFDLVKTVKDILAQQYSPDGFNIGVNCGETAGQTIFHAHIHVIPRYKGDAENPRGGVRHVIPGKGFY